MTEDPLAGLEPAPPPWASIVILPYVKGMLRTETARALDTEAPWHLKIEIDPNDPYAYGRILTAYWNNMVDLVVVEHDVVPPIGAITAMLACEQQWCAHGYDLGGHHRASTLGCTRFSRHLMAAHPMLALNATRDQRSAAYMVPWGQVGSRIVAAIEHQGLGVHEHLPAAVHLHEYGDPDATPA